MKDSWRSQAAKPSERLNINKAMKKQYSKPSVQVIDLKHRQMILCGSNGDKSNSRKAPSDYDDEFSFIPGSPADMNRMA
jgi:hypothetical protein